MSYLPQRWNTWDAVGSWTSTLNQLFMMWLISIVNLTVHMDLMSAGLLVLAVHWIKKKSVFFFFFIIALLRVVIGIVSLLSCSLA